MLILRGRFFIEYSSIGCCQYAALCLQRIDGSIRHILYLETVERGQNCSIFFTSFSGTIVPFLMNRNIGSTMIPIIARRELWTEKSDKGDGMIEHPFAGRIRMAGM